MKFIPKKDVEGAVELLNEKLYKSLARKLYKESNERIYDTSDLKKEYSCQELFRDSHVKKQPIFVMNKLTTKNGTVEYYEYIFIGDINFKIHRIDNQRQHIWYTIVNNIQLTLF